MLCVCCPLSRARSSSFFFYDLKYVVISGTVIVLKLSRLGFSWSISGSCPSSLDADAGRGEKTQESAKFLRRKMIFQKHQNVKLSPNK